MFFHRKKKKNRFFKKSKTEKNVGTIFRLKRLWRITKWLVVIAVVAFIALQYHFHRLDRIIAAKFDKPRKWDLPSRVYSDAEYLYPGLDIKARALVEKLDRLGYRNTGDSISGPGDYSAVSNRLDIYLHDFDYPGEAFKGFAIRLALQDGAITEIRKFGDSEVLELVRLEPEEISSIFTDAMEDRTVVNLDQVPKHLVEAIILIEDERFLKHSGVDPVGIMRAAVVNLTKMRIAQGGSTLTQQLVKNYFLYPERSLTRKINEMLIAYRIEKAHSKAEILEAYLNEIYLGQRGSSSVSGVEEASRLYFAKDVGQITLGEAALLAGMIRSPSEYNPIKSPEKARVRRDVVLRKMFDDGFISNSEYAEAVAEKIITPKSRLKISTAPYFIDFVKRQLSDLYPQEVLQTEGLRIFTTLDMHSEIVAEKSVAEELTRLEKENANVLPKNHAEPLQACLIAIQPSTGFVRALVGGRDYAASQFDRCTQAMRQPGSTFKPFVYLTAVDPRRSRKPFNASSVIDDAAFEVEAGGKMWSPENYDKKVHGPVTLATALAQSYNIATAKLAIDSGLEEIVATAKDAGITTPLDPVPSLALGSFEVLPIEMASAYTIFPNGGIKVQPIAIINVVTKEGEILEKKNIKMKRAFDAQPVFITTVMMKGVMDRGTGASARAMGFTALSAGKTGTTSNYRDAWFVGFTPNLLALSWVGYDDNAEIRMSGGKAALPIWTSFMKKVAPKTEGDFPSPAGVVLVKVDPRTGGLAGLSCPSDAQEAFIEGTEPTKTCERIQSGAANQVAQERQPKILDTPKKKTKSKFRDF